MSRLGQDLWPGGLTGQPVHSRAMRQRSTVTMRCLPIACAAPVCGAVHGRYRTQADRRATRAVVSAGRTGAHRAKALARALQAERDLLQVVMENTARIWLTLTHSSTLSWPTRRMPKLRHAKGNWWVAITLICFRIQKTRLSFNVWWIRPARRVRARPFEFAINRGGASRTGIGRSCRSRINKGKFRVSIFSGRCDRECAGR